MGIAQNLYFYFFIFLFKLINNKIIIRDDFKIKNDSIL